ncbi:MAG: AtpZ/AtpI family protein [Myxococcaceae bacterium]
MRRAGPVLSAVWRFTGASAVGVAAGLFVDRALGTSPAFILVGLGIGLTVGFYAMYRSLAGTDSKGPKA